jgi:urease accessory protein
MIRRRYDAGMHLAEPLVSSWKARLALHFAFQDGKTALARKSHDGPLVVQKPLYPEGGAICHAIVVHPPGGIAGGDELALSASIGDGSAALLTTPGAAKWYRSGGPWAKQSVAFDVKGTLEWLPQETIVFDGALADMDCEVNLGPDGRYIGWEILCLGRTGSGERFAKGRVGMANRISRNGKPVWFERGGIDGGARLMQSAAGLGGKTVCATLVAAAAVIDDSLLRSCREVDGAAVTRLPGLLVARHLGDSSEAAKAILIRLWTKLRPELASRDAVEPRIWKT